MTGPARAVERAGELLHRHIGLRLEPSLRGRLTRALHDAAGFAGLDPDAFVDALADDPASLQSLCDRVTVQETGFFRHPEQFEVLARLLVPMTSQPARIWSAGCANGQEAYSLAMVLAETGVDGTVLATDVSLAAVRRTREALYSDRELSGLSAARQLAHGARLATGWVVSPDIRRRVEVEVRNLLAPLPAEIAGCQIVFCRNVLIYFTPDHAAAFLERLADQLAPGAHLFLGGAESGQHISNRFEPLHFGHTFVYRVRERGGKVASRSDGARPPAGRLARVRRAQSPPAEVGRERSRPSRSVATASPPSWARASAPVSVDDLMRRGRDAHHAGDHAAAIQAFRQWAYLEPDDPIAHFHLGAALEDAGEIGAASRSFDISRALLMRGAGTASLVAFGGFGLDDVLRHLEAKRGSR